MGKHKLIRVSESDLRDNAKEEIVDFINSRFASGRDTALQDIQNVFQKPPYSLSEGTVINYLNDLCSQKKLNTWKIKNRRYYGPPKISLPIKVGLAVLSVIVIATILIDSFVSPDIIREYIYFGQNFADNPVPISVTPISAYLIVLTIFFTSVWYFTEKNKEKKGNNNRKLFK